MDDDRELDTDRRSNGQFMPGNRVTRIDNPMQVARDYRDMLNVAAITTTDLAHLFKVSEAKVRSYLNLFQFPLEIQNMIESGELCFSNARLIVQSVPQKFWYVYALRGRTMSVNQFEKHVKRIRRTQKWDTQSCHQSQKPAKNTSLSASPNSTNSSTA